MSGEGGTQPTHRRSGRLRFCRASRALQRPLGLLPPYTLGARLQATAGVLSMIQLGRLLPSADMVGLRPVHAAQSGLIRPRSG